MRQDFHNFVDLLMWRGESQPDDLVFQYFPDGETLDATLSFGELNDKAKIIAAHLQQRQLRGERVLLLYPPGLDFICAFVGCLYAGTIPVPAYPPEPHRLAHTLKRLQLIIQDARTPAVLTDSLILDLAQKLMQSSQHAALERLIWLQSDRLEPGPQWQHPGLEREDIAFLQYTSGSTSRPKGVVISHGNLLSNMEMLVTACGHSARDRLVCWVPFYHDMGLVGHLLQVMYMGGETLIMPPIAFLKQPLRWLKLISDSRAVTSAAPNFAFDLCVRKISPAERDSLDLSSLKVLMNAAEPIHAQTLTRFIDYFAPAGLQRRALYPGYGMAETTVFISGSAHPQRPVIRRFDRQALEQHRAEPVEETQDEAEGLQLVGCGQSWGEQVLCIVDPDRGVVLPDGQIGEIWIQGPHVAQGYWQQPELTAEAFGAELPEHRGHFVRTGDLGFVLDGEIYVTGRIKEILIVRGRNLYPQDLERSINALRAQHAAIRPGCGVAFDDKAPDDSSESVVFVQEVTPEKMRHSAPEEVARAIASRLTEEHAVPVSAVVLVQAGTLPKTSSGKLMRKACQRDYGRQFENSPIEALLHWSPHTRPVAEARSGAQQADPNTHPNTSPNTSSESESTQPESARPRSAELELWLLQWLEREAQIPAAQLELDHRFQGLGLDSLLAVRLVADLEQAWGLKLSDTLLWDYPTPRLLLAHLSAPTAASRAAPVSQTNGPHPTPSAGFSTEPIAIVGMSCRFPGKANCPESFWQLLSEGVDALQPIPPDRWDVEAYYDPKKGRAGKMYVREGGFLEQVDGFDPQFFQISPREAPNLDPQQRLLLELSWEAFEDAGFTQAELHESDTGVFVGVSNLEYLRHSIYSGKPSSINAYSGTGNALSVVAGRIAYWLGLQGPSFTLDTACSSSLVAVHQACQSLRTGECEQALAGGVNLMLAPHTNIYFSRLQALSPDSRCKSFDAGANGFVRSEGGGLVVLKRLSDAQRDGDRIWGLIQGSAINHDGPSNGLTAPNGKAQRKVIQKALAQSGLQPTDIAFVETHGTGTPLGDPIEVEALQECLLSPERKTPLYLGAVKSNLGHLESAAGIAGLLKGVLSLKQGALPANLHFNQLNPKIQPHPQLAFPLELTALPSDARYAGLSSFGISGTNAHVILGRYDAAQRPGGCNEGAEKSERAEQDGSSVLLPLSAHNEAALRERMHALANWLDSHPHTRLPDLSYTLTQRRSHLRQRWGALVNSLEAFKEALQEQSQPEQALTPPLKTPRVGFVFPGQGAQWLGMGQELWQRSEIFKSALQECENAFAALDLDWQLSEVLLQPHAAQFERMDVIQPLIFAVQLGLSRIWQSWGVEPEILIGHSMGEVAAAHIAGALSLEDAAVIICRRSQILAQQAQDADGGMLFVALSPEACEVKIQERQADGVCIGVHNGPASTVLSGDTGQLLHLQAQFESDEVFCAWVPVSVASHSPQVAPYREAIEEALQGLESVAPRIPMISSVSAEPIEGLDTRYWYDNLRQKVRFAEALQRAREEGINLWIEISAHPLLLQDIQDNYGAQDCRSVPSLKREQSERVSLQHSALRLYQAGVKLNWEVDPLNSTAGSGRLLSLPSYPWQRKRYWIDAPSEAPDGDSAAAPSRAPETKAQQAISPPTAATERGERQKKSSPPSLYQLRWEAQALAPQSKKQPGQWLLLGADDALNMSLSLLLEAQQQKCVAIHRDALLNLDKAPMGLDLENAAHIQALMDKLGASSRTWHGVIVAWPLPEAALPECALHYAQLCLQFLQAFAQLESAIPPRLYWVTQGAWGHEEETPQLAYAPALGLLRSAFYEYPQWHCTQIDLPSQAKSHNYTQLAQELLANSPETQVVLRSSGRSVARIAELPDPEQEESRPANTLQLDARAQYVITGGLGELGALSAERLIQGGARKVVLINRQGAESPERQGRLQNLRKLGAEIQLLAVDVSDAEALGAAWLSLRSQGPIKGLIHAAGVLQDGLIAGQDPARLAQVLAPKVHGAWALHQLTQEDPLDFFVCYSSVTGVLGMPAQANYAAANAFLDALVQWRRQRGLPALSIQWGPWARPSLTQNAQAQQLEGRTLLQQYGFTQLQAQEGLRFLHVLLEQKISAALVMGVDLRRFFTALPQTQHLPLWTQLARTQNLPFAPQVQTRTQSLTAGAVSTQADPQLATDEALSQERLQSFLMERIARILNIPQGELQPENSLRNVGFDSLMALELKSQLQQEFGLQLKASARFQSMSIAEICAKILEGVEFQGPES